ncbi:MAG: sugar phosphate isomerase/epimerase family protein [Pirellulaceae bacterium]
MKRRTFLQTAVAGAVAARAVRVAGATEESDSAEKQRVPLKVGIRAASMKMVGDLDVIRTAARVPGLMGVELQVTHGKANLRDWDVVRQYKAEAHRWGMQIPSLAGVWDRGVQFNHPAAVDSLAKSIRAAELLGSRTILVAFFRQNAPDMTRDASYGPVVDTLKKAARPAADAGVIMGLENSLSPADNRKLVDLVDDPAVRIYYDLHNMAFYGHGDQAVQGIKLLGNERLCMVHVKNEKMLLEEPGMVDWVAAFRAFSDIQYDGWYIYETAHDSIADCLADTVKNNAFLKDHAQMPLL